MRELCCKGQGQKECSSIEEEATSNDFNVFAVHASKLMYKDFFTLLPDMNGYFNGASGWLQFTREWMIAAREKSQYAFCSPVGYQLEQMQALLLHVNRSCGTQWTCSSSVRGPPCEDNIEARARQWEAKSKTKTFRKIVTCT